MMIEHCSKVLADHRKDLIKFAWYHLKAEDATTKHWAYATMCRFIAAYDTPPKIILQVNATLSLSCQVSVLCGYGYAEFIVC